MSKRTAMAWSGVALLLLMLLLGRPAFGACAGDCAGDGVVAVNELVLGVNMALGNLPVAQCAGFDVNGNGQVAVNELVAAVANALTGCPFTGLFSARIDVGDGETATIDLLVAADGEATGTLRVDATAFRAKLRLEIPLLTLTGTVDLDTGEYHLTGTVEGEDGDVPVDIAGTLPDRVGAGTLDLEIGAEPFTGSIVAGDGRPTPTPTQVVSTPTPTPTGTPGTLPTEDPSCPGGFVSAIITNVSGTNSYASLGGPLEFTGLSTILVSNPSVGSFGGGTVPCNLMAGDIIRRVQFSVLAIGGVIEVGHSYEIGNGLGQPAFDYIETPTSNPLGTRGWSAASGAFIIDSIDGSMVRFRVVNAFMAPERSFSAQTPATGTFSLDAVGIGTRLMRP